MHLGYRQNLSHLIFLTGYHQKPLALVAMHPSFRSGLSLCHLADCPQITGWVAMKVTSLSSFSLGSISLHNAAVATCNILCPFIVGMYTSDSTLIETSINGLIHCVKHSPFLFRQAKIKDDIGNFRNFIELVIVSTCDLVDRNSLNAALGLQLIESIVTSKRVKWCYMGSVGRIISSLLHLICRGEDEITASANKSLSIVFEHVMQYAHIPNDFQSIHAKGYKDETDPCKAIIELLLDHVDRYHYTMNQTDYAILQDRQLEHELLGNWSKEMWDVANNIIGNKDNANEGRSLFIILSLLCKISNLRDANDSINATASNHGAEKIIETF